MTSRPATLLSEVRGHEAALAALTTGLGRGRLHHAYRFEGPDGVGKELVARGVAQALLCEEQQDGLACGSCSACRRSAAFNEEPPEVPLHPDLVLAQRGLYPAAMLGRSTPESSGLGIEQIRRVVLSRAAYPPHEGRALVFIIRDAEEMTAGAANCLLKTLEEPGPGVHFFLLTSRPRRLLDTIRSRTQPVRFGPLPDSQLRELLRSRELDLDDALLGLSAGSVARALHLSQPEHRASARRFVDDIAQALKAPDLAAAVAFAAEYRGDRHALREDLHALASSLATSARREVENPRRALRQAKRYELTLTSLEMLERNLSPALAIESLVAELRHA